MKNTKNEQSVSKKVKLCVLLATLYSLMHIFSACDQPADTSNKIEPIAQRYETVPISSTNSTAPGFLYSFYYEKYNYYGFILGHVNYVPLAYRGAVFYDGRTPITIGYTRSELNENSIKRTITTTIENSVTKSYSESYKVSSEVGASFFGIGSKVEAQMSSGYGWVDTEVRSYSDTIEETTRKVTKDSDSISATIGNNNEPPGKYRYSLFATTDVYYIAKVDRYSFKKVDSFIEVCARPESFTWRIDYDPEGDFGKTSVGNLLVIPKVDFSKLPEPNYDVGKTVGPTGGGGTGGIGGVLGGS
jgi:hypothetical protein